MRLSRVVVSLVVPGSMVMWDDQKPPEEVTIDGFPGEQSLELDFEALDARHNLVPVYWVTAAADGFSAASVVVASPGVEADFHLVTKRARK